MRDSELAQPSRQSLRDTAPGLPFQVDDILMTNVAAGAIITVLKSALDPGKK